ncbi:MAG TPA: hypothetical protein VF407_21635, partial [Polyangiaceae bacterium]
MSAYREAGSPPTDDGALTKAAAGVVRVDHENGALVVSWHWFSLGSLGYFLGGLGVIASLSVVDIEEAGLLFFVRLLAVLIAVALLYVGATGIFNRTRIVVTDAQVVCKHGPVWASAPSPLRREEIAKVYADSRVVRGAKGSRITYHYVMATLADGRTRTLADGDLTEAKARAAARVLTSYLDLEAPKPAPARSRFANVSVTEAADGEVDVIHDDAALVLSWSWRGRSALVMSFFGLFVSGVAGAFVSVAIEHSAAA